MLIKLFFANQHLSVCTGGHECSEARTKLQLLTSTQESRTYRRGQGHVEVGGGGCLWVLLSVVSRLALVRDHGRRRIGGRRGGGGDKMPELARGARVGAGGDTAEIREATTSMQQGMMTGRQLKEDDSKFQYMARCSNHPPHGMFARPFRSNLNIQRKLGTQDSNLG